MVNGDGVNTQLSKAERVANLAFHLYSLCRSERIWTKLDGLSGSHVGLTLRTMDRFHNSLLCLMALGVLVSCAVISSDIRSEAEPPVAFKTLVDQADQFVGRTVILGGYILETRNKESETVIEVLQVPMRIGEEPDIKDSSEGRFLVYQKGFLDPEIYSKDRVITVAGNVIGSGDKAIGDDRIRYLKIENREIYLWPDYQKQPYPYPYPVWPYPYHWHRHPFYRHHYWYW